MSSGSIRGGSQGPAARRHQRLVLGLLTTAWLGLVVLGAWYAQQRQNELRQLIVTRVPQVARAVELLFDSMRYRALLAAFRDRNSEAMTLDTAAPDYRLWLLTAESNGYRVIRDSNIGRALDVVEEGRFVSTKVQVRGDATQLMFWPETKPEFIGVSSFSVQ